MKKGGEGDVLVPLVAQQHDVVEGDNKSSQEENQLRLYEAIRANDLELVKELVRGGCHVNQRDKNGYTPLHVAVDARDRASIVDYLIRRGADVTKALLPWKYTPVHAACMNGDMASLPALVKELHHRERSLDTHLTAVGDTPLILAAVNNQPDVIHYLLSKKADIHACGSENRSPVEWAAKNRRYDAVTALVARRADINRAAYGHESVLTKCKKSDELLKAVECGLALQEQEGI